MAVDPAVTESMLGPFRGMLNDLQAQGCTGPDVEECAAALAEMDALVAAATDVGELSTTLANSGLYLRFSDAYTRVMIAASSAPMAGAPGEASEEPGSPGTMAEDPDAPLLAQMVTAYEDAARRLEETGDDRARLALPAIRRVVELGRSGSTYPAVLRTMETEGLVDALSGAVVTRSALEADLDHARALRNPVAITLGERLLARFDEMADAAPFGHPDPFLFGLERTRITWEAEPALIRRRMLQWRWIKMVEDLVDWLDAHASFAPTDDRWAGPGLSPAEVQRNIDRTKACQPGVFRAREALAVEAFGLDWKALDACEFVQADCELGIVGFSDARLELARATETQCHPGAQPGGNLVARTEELVGNHAHMRSS